VLAGLAGRGVTFDATVCGSDVRNTKPDPEPYHRAAALVGAPAGRCVALEDSPNGVAAAEAAGCVTVVVPGVTAVEPAPGRFIAASLADVDLALLRSLAEQAYAQT
jgi:beta-phosphoglucomutase-like phosphatase (HAD superfamily)